MEEELKVTKEACTERVGEEGIGRHIAGNVKDLMINDAIARIQAATSATPVCEELNKYTDIEHICSFAMNKLYGLIQDEGRRRRVAGETYVADFGCIDDMLAQEATDPVISAMEIHGTNESIQARGFYLLCSFVGHARNETPISLIASTRGVQTIFSALERFPDSKRVNGSALGIHLSCPASLYVYEYARYALHILYQSVECQCSRAFAGCTRTSL